MSWWRSAIKEVNDWAPSRLYLPLFFLKGTFLKFIPRFHNPITGFWKTNTKWPFTFFNFHLSQRELSSLQLQIFQSQYRSSNQAQTRKIGKFSWWILCTYWNFCFAIHDFIFHRSWSGIWLFLKNIYLFRAQSFTSLMADLCQDIKRVSSFSRCLNGTFPWSKCSIKTLLH